MSAHITTALKFIAAPVLWIIGLAYWRWDAKRDAARQRALEDAERRNRIMEAAHAAEQALPDDIADLRDRMRQRGAK
jgi:hypothetical protein